MNPGLRPNFDQNQKNLGKKTNQQIIDSRKQKEDELKKISEEQMKDKEDGHIFYKANARTHHRFLDSYELVNLLMELKEKKLLNYYILYLELGNQLIIVN